MPYMWQRFNRHCLTSTSLVLHDVLRLSIYDDYVKERQTDATRYLWESFRKSGLWSYFQKENEIFPLRNQEAMKQE